MATIKGLLGSESWHKFRELTLPEENVIAGVCSALGKTMPLAAWMWRVLFCATAFAWGIGVAAYIILWICIPGEKKKTI